MKILVIVDMQKDFITGALGNAECLNSVEPVAELIEKGGYDRIYVTYDTHQENYLKTNEGLHLPVEHCIKGREGHELDEKVSKALEKSGAPVIKFEKPSFGSLEFANTLREDSAIENSLDTQIDFCGVCTGICVISNVMLAKAALPETNIRVIAKACACVTPDTHKTALDAMRLCHIDIVE